MSITREEIINMIDVRKRKEIGIIIESENILS